MKIGREECRGKKRDAVDGNATGTKVCDSFFESGETKFVFTILPAFTSYSTWASAGVRVLFLLLLTSRNCLPRPFELVTPATAGRRGC